MLTRLLFLSALLLTTLVFLTGAWPGPTPSFMCPAQSSLTTQPVSRDAGHASLSRDAKDVLRKAVEKLSPERAPWLKTKIRQTMTGAESRFVAEGFLQRGPNHCVRLEMSIVTEGQSSRLIVVSDGEMIAEARLFAQQKPIVVVERLPADGGAAKDQFLAVKGCGGPCALLEQLHRQILNASLQTGVLGDKPVIRVRGDLAPGQGGNDAVPASARSCCVDLDANTLWPHRLEWHGLAPGNALLRIEFLDPELGRELSTEECLRLFSYRPD